jgi:TRAP-type C4-dicarboxylate transport system permease small subunit
MLALEKGVNALAHAVERVLAVALILGIGLNFINVVGRYLGGFSLNGVDEIEIYILIWIAFLGAAIVTWRGEHLRMDVLVTMCPPGIQKGIAILEMLVLFSVTSFAAFQSFKYVERIYALGAVSDIAHVPTWIPHSAITIGFGAMATMVLLRGVQKLMRNDWQSRGPGGEEART